MSVTPLAVILVLTVLQPNGKVRVETEVVGPWKKLKPYERCIQLKEAFLRPPLMEPVTAQAAVDDRAYKRGAACIVMPPGGIDS